MLSTRLAFLVLLTAAGTARADWRPVPITLAPEPARKLELAGPLILALQTRHVTVYDPGTNQARRAFTLRGQEDGLVDLVATAQGWWLASRRELWRSDDRGFTWRSLHVRKPSDPAVWLALFPTAEGLVGAASDGLFRIEPGRIFPWGTGGRTPVRGAAASREALVVESTRGFVRFSSDGLRAPLDLRAGPLHGAVDDAGALVLAADDEVLRCAERCAVRGRLPGLRYAAVHDGSYWAATTDSVWREDAAGGWRESGAGLGALRPVALASSGTALWVLGDQGLARWVPRDADAATVSTAEGVPADPPIGAVRQWALARIPVGGTTVDSWRRRVRWQAAAPRVGVTVSRDIDDRYSETFGNTIGISTTQDRILIGPDFNSISRAESDGYRYGLALTWNLEELVFNPRELNVSNEIEDIYRFRESVALDVTRIYYDRARTRLDLARALDDHERALLAVRLDELTAALDYYTGGRFSAALATVRPDAPDSGAARRMP